MKNYSDTIELINQYINQTLSHSEILAFQSRIESDSEFQVVYQEQLELIQGIKRIGLKQDIRAGKQAYLQAKWFKVLGIFGFCVALLLVTWLYFNNQTQTNNQPLNQPVATQVSDSIPKETNPIVNTVEVDTAIVESGIQDETDSQVVIKKTKDIKIVIPENEKQESVIVQDSVTKIAAQIAVSTNNEMLESFLETVKKKSQVIALNTRETFTITLKEGTILNIPARAFVDANTGKLARGIIQLEVTEYYKLSDMLLGNLSTTSNSEQLETGGMLYMKAHKNGSELKLIKPIQIGFPYQNEKPDMQLFSGDKSEGNMNWSLESNRINSARENEMKVIPLTGEGNPVVPFNVVENAPVFPGCESLLADELKTCFNTKMTEFITKNFNLKLAEELGLTGLNEIKAFFKINAYGDIIDINVNASIVNLGNEFVRVINLMPKLRPGLQRGKPVTVHYYMPFKFDLPGKTVARSFITVKSNQVLNSKFDKPMDSIRVNNITVYNTYEVSNYAFSSAKMGWINCDRFVRDGKQKVKFKFKMKQADGANVKMVFKSISSILPSKTNQEDVSFGLVPIDEDVILVAIKKVDDTFYLGIKETKTENITALNFDFKPVTIEELKQEMIKLNALFD